MGLLDDAIREHLDLKRRRGADPAEIERAEREALGPVRRNRDTALAEDGDGLDYDAPGSAFDEPDEGIASDLVDEGHDAPRFDDDLVAARSSADDAPGTEDLLVVQDDGDLDDDDLADEDEEFEDDAPATRVMRTADIPAAPQGTTEFDVEEAFADEDDDPFADEPAAPAPAVSHDGDEDEDVLEETPEFLQDTPDHDRLWFEQRPPRDFDFDG